MIGIICLTNILTSLKRAWGCACAGLPGSGTQIEIGGSMTACQPQGFTLFGTLAVALTAGVLVGGLSSTARADDPLGGSYPETVIPMGTIDGGLQHPVGAVLTNGKFAVAMSAYGSAKNRGIYAQLFNAAGAPQGQLIKVISTLVEDDDSPTIAAQGTGFIVVFSLSKKIGGPGKITGQRYSATGVALGKGFTMSSSIANHAIYPVVTTLSDGGVVACWFASIKGDGGNIYCLRYDSKGKKVGKEFLANTTTGNLQNRPSVAALSNGGFVVTWESRASVFAQRFGANSAKVGSEFKVNTTVNSFLPTVTGLKSGGFVVAWNLSGQGMTIRQYDAAGLPVDGEFPLGDTSLGGHAAMTVLADDRFLVAGSISGNTIAGRVLDAVNGASGDTVEFTVSTSGSGAFPSAITISATDMFVFWEQQAAITEIRLRRLTFPAVQ
jgi:hypothetical protein